MRVIASEADLEAGVAHLTASEPRFETALRAGGPPPLRLRDRGFDALFEIIVEQQVSVAAGRAIWARVAAAGCVTPAAVLARDEEDLRALGLSRPKARAARALAAAVEEGAVCFSRQRSAPVGEAMTELTAVKGIGPWTATVYQMFCEKRADLFPSGDVALQEAARVLFDLDARPDPKAFDAMAEAWSPWRAVAARMLWSYYRSIKGREGKA